MGFFPWRESCARAAHGDRVPDARWGMAQHGHEERADMGGLTRANLQMSSGRWR